MSLFGKVLALLNIFGAIALISFASMDYGKRASWAHANFVAERVVRGLPLDDDERDSRGVKIAPQLGKETLTQLFQAAGGSPRQTQLEEVRAVKTALDGEVGQAQDIDQESAALARILLPLATTLGEHEQLLACRAWQSTKADAGKLRARYLAAFRAARQSPLPGETFDNSFRAALRTLPVQPNEPVQPTEALTALVLGMLPAAPDEKGFGTALKAGIDEQSKRLKARYDEHFSRVLTGTADGKAMNLDPRKAAVARLLFGVAVYNAEKEFPRDAKMTAAEYGEKFAKSQVFEKQVRRVYAVCGLQHGVDAVIARAALLRGLAGELRGVMTGELMAFVADHAALVEQAREAAYLLGIEQAKKQESARRKGVQDTLLKRREADIELLTRELNDSRVETGKKFKELRDLSQKLLDDRLQARDLIRKTEEAERTIRALENRIRDLEKGEQ